jgi:hypothetical protein
VLVRVDDIARFIINANLSEAAFAAETSGDPAANQLSADLLGFASVLDHLVPFREGKRRDKSFLIVGWQNDPPRCHWRFPVALQFF